MIFRGTKVGRPFQILVANLSGRYDPQGNPIPQRQGFEEQLVNNVHNRMRMGLLTGPATNATASVTVADNDFTTGAAVLTVGEYELESGVHFTPGGTPALTATALATAINNLPGYSATAALAVVSILGPLGPDGDTVEFSVFYNGTKTNFTLNPTTGAFSPGGPTIQAPRIF